MVPTWPRWGKMAPAHLLLWLSASPHKTGLRDKLIFAEKPFSFLKSSTMAFLSQMLCFKFIFFLNHGFILAQPNSCAVVTFIRNLGQPWQNYMVSSCESQRKKSCLAHIYQLFIMRYRKQNLIPNLQRNGADVLTAVCHSPQMAPAPHPTREQEKVAFCYHFSVNTQCVAWKLRRLCYCMHISCMHVNIWQKPQATCFCPPESSLFL